MVRAYGFDPQAGLQGLCSTSPLWQAEVANASLRHKDTSYHYLHTDHLGTPMLATDKTGAVTWKAVMDAFGEAKVLPQNRITVNLRFPGQYFDQESGMHYNLHRDYNPKIGRYLQSDPIGLNGGSNLFAYAGGNPLIGIDSTGLQSSMQWCYQSPANAEVCNEAGMLLKPIRIPPPISFPENCDDACEKAILDASNIYWKLTTKRIPQYETGGTRGRGPNHARSILELQKALKKAIARVRLHCGDGAVHPEWEEAANAPLPK